MPAWRINREHVSHDLMNGEVIAIHLGTGIYYSLRGSAAEMWRMLEAPTDVERIAGRWQAAQQLDGAKLRAEVTAFIDRLREEGLITEANEAEAVAPARDEPQPYVAPELERFADLQDLLLLDPIHDVGAQGWPHRPERAS